jgi:hypothetical protein
MKDKAGKRKAYAEGDYGTDEESEDGPRSRAERRVSTDRRAKGSVNIGEPMSLWILLLLLAVASRYVLQSTSLVPHGNGIYRLLSLFPDFLLTMPGILVLPLVVGAIIGAEVGSRSFSMASAVRSGLLNGIYAVVVYAMIIAVVYIALAYITPQTPSLSGVIQNSVLLPAIVMLLSLEAFAVLSHSRRVDS